MPIRKADSIIITQDFQPTSVEDLLLKFRALIIERLTAQLQAVDRVSTGSLAQSIDGQVTKDSSSVTLEISMEDYWKFVNDGVNGYNKSWNSPYNFKNNGKAANIGAMLEFINNRAIDDYKTPSGKIIFSVNPPAKKQKQIKSLKSKRVKKAFKQYTKEKRKLTLAYLIGKRIKKVGIKPTNFFNDVINEDLRMQMEKELTDALKMDIELNFTT